MLVSKTFTLLLLAWFTWEGVLYIHTRAQWRNRKLGNVGFAADWLPKGSLLSLFASSYDILFVVRECVLIGLNHFPYILPVCRKAEKGSVVKNYGNAPFVLWFQLGEEGVGSRTESKHCPAPPPV